MARSKASHKLSDPSDELFRFYGQSMLRAQCLEQDVETFVEAVLKADTNRFSKTATKLSDESLGTMWSRVEEASDRADPVWSETIRVFIRWRNHLVHDFLILATSDLAVGGSPDAALTFLRDFEKACDVTAHHLALLREAMALHAGKRFIVNVEQSLAKSNDINHSTVITFRRFSPNA